MPCQGEGEEGRRREEVRVEGEWVAHWGGGAGWVDGWVGGWAGGWEGKRGEENICGDVERSGGCLRRSFSLRGKF